MAIVPLRRSLVAALLLWLGLFQAPGHAHRLPPEVAAFFKVDGSRLRVVVRVPTAILGDARLPRRGATLLDLAAIDSRLGAVATEIARSLDVTDEGRPLPPGAARWMVSIVGDRSFADFESAMAHIDGPRLPVDRPVYWDEAYVDVAIDYPIASPTPKIAARLNGLRLGGEFSETRATYIPASATPRVITVNGAPQRVSFEPSLGAAVATVLAQAVDQATAAHLVWLMTVCLAMAARRVTGALAAFVGAQAIALAVVALRPSPIPEAGLDVVLFALAAVVALAAMRAMIGGGPASLVWLGGLAGIAGGAWLGAQLQRIVPLAGSHALLVTAVYVALVSALILLVFVILLPLIRASLTWRAPAWLTTAVWAAVPAHEASHAMMAAGARLAAQDEWLLPPAVATVSTHWPLLAAAAMLAATWLATRGRHQLPAVADGALR